MEEITVKPNTTHKIWFFLTLLYLVVDYGRPQDILPIIGYMKPGAIVILMLAFCILFSKKIWLSDSKQTRLIWCFIILTVIFVPVARNNHFAYITAKTMLLYMPFMLSTIILVNSIERLRKIISANIIIMVYICLYSLSHLGQGSGNYFKDENDLALYVNTFLPFCVFLFFYEKTKIKKTAYAVAGIIGLIAVTVSFSRGGFIGLVCMAAVAWLFSPKKLVSIIIMFLVGAMVYICSGEPYKKEMSTITNTKDDTVHGRLLSWQAAWDMFLDNPLGVGGNNFPVRFPEYQSSEFKKGMWGRAAHSLWFTLIPEFGIPGIIIYVALLYYNIKDIFFLKTIKYGDDPNLRYLYFISLAYIPSLAGFFASATFLSVLYYPHYWYLTALLVAMTKTTNRIRFSEY